MDINESIEEYILDQRIRGNSEKTIDYYKITLAAFAEFVKKIDTANITILDGKHFYISLVESRRKNSVSVQSYIRALRAYLRWLFENDYIGINIPLRFKLPKAERKVIQRQAQTLEK